MQQRVEVGGLEGGQGVGRGFHDGLPVVERGVEDDGYARDRVELLDQRGEPRMVTADRRSGPGRCWSTWTTAGIWSPAPGGPAGPAA